MGNETKVGPGVVRLTLMDGGETGPYDFRVAHIATYGERWERGEVIGTRIIVAGVTRVMDNGGFLGAFDVTEPHAEVAALIAEAQRAERREMDRE